MKKVLALVLASLMLVFLVSCGGSSEPSPYEGKYVCVYANLLDYAMTGDDVPEITLEIASGGKAKWVSDTDNSEFEWKIENDKMTLSSAGLDYATASLEEDKIIIDDWMGLGFAYTFAKEGSAAADPSLYITLSDDEEAMVGTWTSYSVEDILGDDLSEDYNADGLTLDVKDDFTYTLTLDGEELESGKWSALGTWASVEESAYDLDWTVQEDGGLKVSVTLDDEYVIFMCD
jgi:hypothetical protein